MIKNHGVVKRTPWESRGFFKFLPCQTILRPQSPPETHTPVDNPRETLWITPVDNMDKPWGKLRGRNSTGSMGIDSRVIPMTLQARLTLNSQSYPQYPPLY
jgi:hypothetical protein